MSLEPTTLDHESPQDARKASGVTAEGDALYQCLRCQRYKPSAAFGHNPHGRTDNMCTVCTERVGVSTQRQRYLKDRSHITVTHKVCNKCEKEKSAESYWLDGKEPDGLKRTCATCMLQHRSPSRMTKPVFDSFTPASAVQPLLDQALAERDALAAEVESLRATVGALQQSVQNQGPRTDLLALHALEDEVRALRQQLERVTAAVPPLSTYAHSAQRALAGAVGPLALRVFRWADHQMLSRE